MSSGESPPSPGPGLFAPGVSSRRRRVLGWLPQAPWGPPLTTGFQNSRLAIARAIASRDQRNASPPPHDPAKVPPQELAKEAPAKEGQPAEKPPAEEQPGTGSQAEAPPAKEQPRQREGWEDDAVTAFSQVPSGRTWLANGLRVVFRHWVSGL